MNPFYNQQPSTPQMNGPFQNIANMIQQFNQFRSAFQGNPQQKVQELLNSGKMSQEQFNQLSQMAQQFRPFIH